MRDGPILAFLLIAWGAQAVLPWQIARLERDRRAPWAYAGLLLLLGGALAAIFLGWSHPDAAAAVGLSPLLGSIHGRLLAVLGGAVLAASAVSAAGWRRLENAGWRILGGFGLAFVAIAALCLELLRAGEGPLSNRPFLAAGCLLLAALGAGELASPGRPAFAILAGPALPLYAFSLPERVAASVAAGGGLLTVGAAALLFLSVRWLPARLRRPTLAAAVLLFGLFLAAAAAISARIPALVLPVA